MLPESDRPAHRPGHEHDIGTYYVVPFEDVAAAVECCDRLVPFTVPRGGVVRQGPDRAVVWFHVPPRATRTTQDGCYLFVSAGVLDALANVAPDREPIASLGWSAIPATSVLIFGEDTLPPRLTLIADAPPATLPAPAFADRVVERTVDRDAPVLLDRRSAVRTARVQPLHADREIAPGDVAR